jgi:hypothetical protein
MVPRMLIEWMALATPVPVVPKVLVEVHEVSWVAVAGFGLALLLAGVQAIGWIIRWTKRRNVVFDRAGRIEVVFGSPFGPNLGLHGIIFSEHKQSLVTSLRVIVVRTRDNSTQRLDAHLWRDPKLTLGGPHQTVTSELAGPFVVPQDSVVPFYGIFVDLRVWQGEMDSIEKDLQQAWAPVVIQNFRTSPIPQTDAEKAQRKAEVEPLYQQFIANDPTNSAARLTKVFSWFAGNYTLQIECDVRGDKRAFDRRWNFRLTEDDERRLRSNIANIQRAFCGVQAPLDQVIIAKYEETT